MWLCCWYQLHWWLPQNPVKAIRTGAEPWVFHDWGYHLLNRPSPSPVTAGSTGACPVTSAFVFTLSRVPPTHHMTWSGMVLTWKMTQETDGRQALTSLAFFSYCVFFLKRTFGPLGKIHSWRIPPVGLCRHSQGWIKGTKESHETTACHPQQSRPRWCVWLRVCTQLSEFWFGAAT